MDFEIEDPYDPFSMDTYLDPQDPSFGDLESMRHLSNVDYSLNSPMIADELEAFIR
nr:VSV L protein homolog {N-terminal} [sigma rhabdovirus, Peptide Partial, 55 aa] [Sigma virus]